MRVPFVWVLSFSLSYLSCSKNVICHFQFQVLKNDLPGSPKKWFQLWRWWGYGWCLFCDFGTKTPWIACMVLWNYGKNTLKPIQCREITILFLPNFYMRYSFDLFLFLYSYSWFGPYLKSKNRSVLSKTEVSFGGTEVSFFFTGLDLFIFF